MKRLAPALLAMIVVVVAVAVATPAGATCVNPQTAVWSYWGWVVNGVYQCAAPIGPSPGRGDLIGQTVIACDGSESTWGHVCDPATSNNLSYSVEYYDDCDCGPDQQGALSKRACPRKHEDAKPARAAKSCEN